MTATRSSGGLAPKLLIAGAISLAAIAAASLFVKQEAGQTSHRSDRRHEGLQAGENERRGRLLPLALDDPNGGGATRGAPADGSFPPAKFGETSLLPARLEAPTIPPDLPVAYPQPGTPGS